MATIPEAGTGSSGGPKAAVIIPHYNDTVRLEKCLAALVPQAAATEVEIVVVDNGSTEDITELTAGFAGVTFLEERKKGAAAARNTGVANSKAPWLFFIDADCIPDADWLATALKTGPYVRQTEGIVGGTVRLFDETPPPRSGAEAFETVFAFPQKEYVERKNFSVTANLLTSRAVFDSTGPFDGSVVEDSDWCQRAVAKGFPIVFKPDLVVAHPTRQDWPSLRKKWKRTTAENYFANGTGRSARVKWGLRALVVAASGPLHLPRILRHPDLTAQERLRGALTLLRLRMLRACWMLRQALLGAAPINT